MLGIMGAMTEEVDSIIAELKDYKRIFDARRYYHFGKLNDIPVVVVQSRIGKVAAATTATTLILEYGVEEIIFTGVAGSADPTVKVGDVVVGTYLYQHDMDASPLFPKYHIPLLDTDRFETNIILRYAIVDAAKQFIPIGTVWQGSIASGDKFFASKKEIDIVKKQLPDILCVEMEGAAVAQVCYEHEVPFAIFRTISDNANEEAPMDFKQFIETIARRYAIGIVQTLLQNRLGEKYG